MPWRPEECEQFEVFTPAKLAQIDLTNLPTGWTVAPKSRAMAAQMVG
jgi:hypothetical protein